MKPCETGGARRVNQCRVRPDGDKHFPRSARNYVLEIIANERLPPFKKNGNEAIIAKCVDELDPFVCRQLRISSGPTVRVAVPAVEVTAGGNRNRQLEGMGEPGGAGG